MKTVKISEKENLDVDTTKPISADSPTARHSPPDLAGHSHCQPLPLGWADVSKPALPPEDDAATRKKTLRELKCALGETDQDMGNAYIRRSKRDEKLDFSIGRWNSALYDNDGNPDAEPVKQAEAEMAMVKAEWEDSCAKLEAIKNKWYKEKSALINFENGQDARHTVEAALCKAVSVWNRAKVDRDICVYDLKDAEFARRTCMEKHIQATRVKNLSHTQKETKEAAVKAEEAETVAKKTADKANVLLSNAKIRLDEALGNWILADADIREAPGASTERETQS